MNGYNLTRAWYQFKFDNPSKVRHIHSDAYFYIIDLWNRLGQKNEFGLPTSVTMESLQIGSYNTYKRCIDELVEFGFIEVVKNSVNQHTSKIIKLTKIDVVGMSNIDKATIKATDEPSDKATAKATDSIIEQYNKGTIEVSKPKKIDTHPMQDWVNDNCPNVKKLKNQLTYEQCDKLILEFTNDKLKDILNRMENYKQLTAKYTSVNLTIRNWIKLNSSEQSKPISGRMLN